MYGCDLKHQDNYTDMSQLPLAYSRGPPTPFTSGMSLMLCTIRILLHPGEFTTGSRSNLCQMISCEYARLVHDSKVTAIPNGHKALLQEMQAFVL